MSMHTLEDAFVQQLRQLFHAERQVRRLLPRLLTTISDQALVEALTEQLQETHAKIRRLHNVFASITHTARSSRCQGMEGLVAECVHLTRQAGEPEVLDALLLAGVQKVQYHQLSCYGTLCTWAEVLGFGQALILLSQNFAQETRAHERLTALARDGVTLYAAEAR